MSSTMIRHDRSISQRENRFERGSNGGGKSGEDSFFFFSLSRYTIRYTRMHASSVEYARIQKRPCRVSLEKRVWTYLPLSTLGPIDDPATPRAYFTADCLRLCAVRIATSTSDHSDDLSRGSSARRGSD